MSIRKKLFWAILVASLLSVGGLGAWVHWQFNHRFLDYLHAQQQRSLQQVVARMAARYESEAGRQALQNNPMQWHVWAQSLIEEVRQESPWARHFEHESHRPPPRADQDSDEAFEYRRSRPPERWKSSKKGERRRKPPPFLERVVLLDADKNIITGGNRVPAALTPVQLGEQVVGYLGLPRADRLTAQVDRVFAQRFARSLWLAGLVAVVIAALLARWLARHFTQPITALRDGASRLAAGELDYRIAETRKDELGALTVDFNQLAAQIETFENNRQQWVADTAHELRTPLSVLRGELEAMRDGVRELNQASLVSLQQEVLRLQRLTDDLYELSTTHDAKHSYSMQATDALALLKTELERDRDRWTQAGLVIEADFPQEKVWVQADADRLLQCFRNLLNNSLRYSDSPARLQISAEMNARQLVLRFADSPPAVPDVALASLFERFYRVDASRNRATGGAGLGLSICRNIIEVHGGEISAYASPLGGLGIKIILPVSQP